MQGAPQRAARRVASENNRGQKASGQARAVSRVVAALTALILLGAALLGFSTAADAQGGARVHLIHGIPETDVDVVAGGEIVVAGFSFGDTQDLSALSGTTVNGLEVRLAGTDTVAISVGDLEVPASGNITAVAHLDSEGTPTLSVFVNDTSPIAAGQGRLIVRHLAAAPNVDVLANGEVAFANVANGGDGSAELGLGAFTAEVVPSGASDPVVIGPAELPIVDGSALIVYAVGSLEGESLTVLTETIDGLGTTPTRVETGNSPINPSDQSTLMLAVALLLGLSATLVVRPTRLASPAKD